MPSTASARPTQVLFETETNKAYFTTGAGLISGLLCEQEALLYRNICLCVTSDLTGLSPDKLCYLITGLFNRIGGSAT